VLVNPDGLSDTGPELPPTLTPVSYTVVPFDPLAYGVYPVWALTLLPFIVLLKAEDERVVCKYCVVPTAPSALKEPDMFGEVDPLLELNEKRNLPIGWLESDVIVEFRVSD